MQVENFIMHGYIQNSFTRVRCQAAGEHSDCVSDGSEKSIDLNEQLIRNKYDTIFMRVHGSSMINAGIFDGDIVIVDKLVKPANGMIVIALLDGEMLIRRLAISHNKIQLIPETPKLACIDVSGFSDCKIWGVVMHVIRSL